jgi:hypothetical protein
MRLPAREAAADRRDRGPAEPAAPGGGRRVPLVGAPQRADDAVDLRRGQRVSDTNLATQKVSFRSRDLGDTQESSHSPHSARPTHSNPCIALFVRPASVR